jgi:hypothetical protein
MNWGIANGYKRFQSSGLNYDPKLHLRHRLKPVDLYVKHTSSALNLVMRMALPWLEPTRYDETLKKFPNYRDLGTRPPSLGNAWNIVTAKFGKGAKLCQMIAYTKTSAKK